MSEFDKRIQSDWFDDEQIKLARDGWIAALKWVLRIPLKMNDCLSTEALEELDDIIKNEIKANE